MELIREINSDTLTLKELKTFVGKKVRIYIEEVSDERKAIKKKQTPLGRYKLGFDLDRRNLRDFAHEEN